MKKLIFSLLAAIAALLPVSAEEPDSTAHAYNSYLRRLEWRERQWMRLIPNLFSLQYAGGIGTISAGIGWDYGPRDKWETHLQIGYLRPRYDWPHYWTLTLREVFTPWTFHTGRGLSVKPLYATLFVNSILHHDFWMSEPERYPHGYYGFSSRMRFHFGLGQRFSVRIPPERRFLGRELTVFYEFSTCDLYIRQKILNKSIPWKNLFSLGLGLQWKI